MHEVAGGAGHSCHQEDKHKLNADYNDKLVDIGGKK